MISTCTRYYMKYLVHTAVIRTNDLHTAGYGAVQVQQYIVVVFYFRKEILVRVNYLDKVNTARYIILLYTATAVYYTTTKLYRVSCCCCLYSSSCAHIDTNPRSKAVVSLLDFVPLAYLTQTNTTRRVLLYVVYSRRTV